MAQNTSGNVTLGLTATLVSVHDGVPMVLTITPPKHTLTDSRHGAKSPSLPFGPFDPDQDMTLDQGLRRWIYNQTHLNPRYVEQLYTFGNRFRDPQELKGGPRVVSVGYLGLLSHADPSGSDTPQWRPVYDFLPWEDTRRVQGEQNRLWQIANNLKAWAAQAKDPAQREARLHRIQLNYGTEGAPFDSERVLERYQLLYEAGLVEEAVRDFQVLQGKTNNLPMDTTFPTKPDPTLTGQQMVLDHRRVLASALQRIRGKIKYRPIIFDLLPEHFTLFQLQQVAEALAGHKLHKQNFRRLVLNEKLVEETDRTHAEGRGRPAVLYKFRESVRYERQSPGVGLPKGRS